MNYILFACNRYYPRGGVEDMVAVVGDLVESEILAAVLAKIRSGNLEKDNRLWVNAVSIQPASIGKTYHWEVRIEKSAEDPALEFCSIKETHEDLGVCGLLPLGVEVVTLFDNTTDLTFYPLLDPEKRDITYLP